MTKQQLDSAQNFEVVIIGGGISGLGIARACSQSGLRTLLVDKGDLGAATSSNSLRIIHGGFRYLQSLNIVRVIRSLRDQARVAREFADLVVLLPCYLPLQGFGLKSRWPLYAASLFYRLLSALCGVKSLPSGILSKHEAEAKLAFLNGHVPRGAFYWHDLQISEPASLHARLADQIQAAGGVVRQHCRATRIQKEPNGYHVALQIDGQEEIIGATVVVKAMGPWKDTLQVAARDLSASHWCKAFNLVFRGNDFGTFGAGLPGKDNRLYFVVGRNNSLAVGTDYLTFEGDPGDAIVQKDEVESLITDIANAIPGLKITSEKLDRVEVGVLPVTHQSDSPEKNLVGSSKITNQAGYIEVLSTKYTTFLSQADQVCKLVMRSLP